MRYEILKAEFMECTELTWDAIDTQIDNEIQKNTCRIIGDSEEEKTYLLLDSQRFHPTISKIHAIMKDKYRLTTLHLYVSKNVDAKTFGRHCDNDNVLIVQSIGKMSYKFDNDQVVILTPGDGLHIPKGMYHDPIPIEPRVTLSFSWN